MEFALWFALGATITLTAFVIGYALFLHAAIPVTSYDEQPKVRLLRAAGGIICLFIIFTFLGVVLDAAN